MTAPVQNSSGAPVAQTERATGEFALRLNLAAQTRATAPLPVAQAQQARFDQQGQIRANGAIAAMQHFNSNGEARMKITAIQTRYKGYRFRSRLEARWAVFLDAANAQWEYEFEGYDLGDSWYLPDFMMLHNPGRGPIVEIKPTAPSSIELQKLSDACALARNGCGAYGALIWGAPGKEKWRAIDKEGDFSWDEDHSTLLDYLTAGEVHSKEIYQIAVNAARSARFEHGEVPA